MKIACTADSMKPTRLYIKKHSITGLRYFGKTTAKNADLYLGSGTRWKRHLTKHGKERVITEWLSGWYTDSNLIKQDALFISEQFNVVNSKEWANLAPENGLNGGALRAKGFKASATTRKRMSVNKKVKQYHWWTDGTIERMSNTQPGPEFRAGQKQPRGSKGKLYDFLTPSGQLIQQITIRDLCEQHNLALNIAHPKFTEYKKYKGFCQIEVPHLL